MHVSVIIPTHARPQLLAVAIQSVLCQTVPPMELIVVDDIGDESTRRIVLDRAEKTEVPVRYLRNDMARGVCGSRNLGAFQCVGDWIAFLDDDDLWDGRFLERMAERARHGDVDLVMSALLRQERGRPDVVRVTPSGMNGDTVLQYRSSMTGSNFLVRADRFCAVRGFDPDINVFNDWDLLVRLLRNGTQYAVVSEPLVEWRDHAGERIATPSARRAEGIERFLARYGCELPPSMRRELRTTALGIRRKHAREPFRYLELSVALALAHGPRALFARMTGMPRAATL